MKSVVEAEREVLARMQPWHAAHANPNTTRRSMVDVEGALLRAYAELKAAIAKAEAGRLLAAGATP